MGNILAHNMPTYAEGTVCGKINKFSLSGFFWKTYEGELVCEGLKQVRDINTGIISSTANTWHFSIDAKACHGENIEDLCKKLQDALKSGQHINIVYLQPLIGLPHQGNTSCYVQKIEYH